MPFRGGTRASPLPPEGRTRGDATSPGSNPDGADGNHTGKQQASTHRGWELDGDQAPNTTTEIRSPAGDSRGSNIPSGVRSPTGCHGESVQRHSARRRAVQRATRGTRGLRNLATPAEASRQHPSGDGTQHEPARKQLAERASQVQPIGGWATTNITGISKQRSLHRQTNSTTEVPPGDRGTNSTTEASPGNERYDGAHGGREAGRRAPIGNGGTTGE